MCWNLTKSTEIFFNIVLWYNSIIICMRLWLSSMIAVWFLIDNYSLAFDWLDLALMLRASSILRTLWVWAVCSTSDPVKFVPPMMLHFLLLAVKSRHEWIWIKWPVKNRLGQQPLVNGKQAIREVQDSIIVVAQVYHSLPLV